MYTADDALKDLNDLRNIEDDWYELHKPFVRLREYLQEQRRKEGIPELLRGG